MTLLKIFLIVGKISYITNLIKLFNLNFIHIIQSMINYNISNHKLLPKIILHLSQPLILIIINYLTFKNLHNMIIIIFKIYPNSLKLHTLKIIHLINLINQNIKIKSILLVKIKLLFKRKIAHLLLIRDKDPKAGQLLNPKQELKFYQEIQVCKKGHRLQFKKVSLLKT